MADLELTPLFEGNRALRYSAYKKPPLPNRAPNKPPVIPVGMAQPAATEAAIKSFQADGFAASVEKALSAAAHRFG